MILPNFRPPYLTPIKIKGSGNNPDSLNWTNIVFDKSEERHTVAEQKITGISSPITLSIEWIQAGGLYLFYRISQTPLPEGITLYNILATGNPNAPAGLTFDPYNNDGIQDNFRLECDMTHGFTSAGAYPSGSCDEIIVNNNDYVAFACYQNAAPPFVPYATFTVTIKNQSNGGVLLDTFDAINQL